MSFGQNLSADTFGGWKNHFHRLERWKKRCLAELEKICGEESDEVVDLVLVYFVWCHSLRDWPIEGNVLEQNVLDENLMHYPEWKICRDIANRCRHYDLKRSPSDKHWSVGREYDPFATPENQLPGEKWFLVFQGEKLELSSVINITFNMWKGILSMNNLDTRMNGRWA